MPKLYTQFIDLPAIRLAYSESGVGPDLILLHGNSESKRIFRKYQLNHFCDFHTIAIDSRGHGQSVSEDTEYSIEQFSEDVIQFCKVRRITKTNLIGYSDGGNIALHLAKKAPELFQKIVAISPNYLVDGTEEDTLLRFTKIYNIMIILRKLGFPLKKQIMRWKLMLTDIGISEDDLRSIQTGMKIIYAENEMIKKEHLFRIAELIPDASMKEIKGCTHMNILTKENTVQVIRDYLIN